MRLSWLNGTGRCGVVAMILLFSLLISVAIADEASPVADNTTGQVKALVALYMIGSDLETEENDITDGIQEIIQGYGDANPDDLEIIVSYGGSKKPGWEGMTIASSQQLKQDLQDGIIGNEALYAYHDPDADMGSKEGLNTFLSWIGEKYTSEKRFLIFSDHGGGWGGFGSDENHDKSGLFLSDISGALNESGYTADLIGFDACLMGEIEVAKAISPYSPLLVGSEETVPGDGWKYEGWISTLAKDPLTDPKVIGKAIVDQFMEREVKGKTLSLIDTTKIADLTGALGSFGEELSNAELSGTKEFASAYRNLSSFGSASTSVDLSGLAVSLGQVFPRFSGEADAIREQVNAVVLYERHDPELSYATGISIMSPDNMTPEDYSGAGEGVTLAPGWDTAYLSLLQFLSGTAGSISLQKTGNNRYEFSDPSGYATVDVAYFRVENGEKRLIGTEPLTPDEDGMYTVPEWDGRWLMIQDNSSSGTGILPAFETVETNDDGTIILRAPVLVNQNEAYLEVETDGKKVESLDLVPYSTDSEGNTMYGNSYEPEPGDVITIGTEGSSESITWTGETIVTYSTLPDGEYAVGLYVDQMTGPEEYVADRYFSLSDGVIQEISSP